MNFHVSIMKRDNTISSLYLFAIISVSASENTLSKYVVEEDQVHNHTHNNFDVKYPSQLKRLVRITIPIERPERTVNFNDQIDFTSSRHPALITPNRPTVYHKTSGNMKTNGEYLRNVFHTSGSHPLNISPTAVDNSQNKKISSNLDKITSSSPHSPLTQISSSYRVSVPQPFSSFDQSAEGHPIYIKTEGGLNTQNLLMSKNLEVQPHTSRTQSGNQDVGITARKERVGAKIITGILSHYHNVYNTDSTASTKFLTNSLPTFSSKGVFHKGNSIKTSVPLTHYPHLLEDKATMLRYLNDIYKMNYTESFLANALGIVPQKSVSESTPLSIHKFNTLSLENPSRLDTSNNLKIQSGDPRLQNIFPKGSNVFPIAENQVNANRVGLANPSRQDLPARNPLNYVDPNIPDLAIMLGLVPSITHQTQVAGSPAGDLNVENHNLIDLGTTTPAPHMVMEIFEHVFSEEEMAHNPLVRGIHDRLEHHMHRIQSSSNSNSRAAILYFLIPVVIFASVMFVMLGVSPEFIGILGLFVPAFIVSMMMDVGSGRSLTLEVEDVVKRLPRVANIHNEIQGHLKGFHDKFVIDKND